MKKYKTPIMKPIELKAGHLLVDSNNPNASKTENLNYNTMSLDED